MPDLDLIKQGEQGVRDRRAPFYPGRSSDPVGLAAPAPGPGQPRCPGVSLGETATLFRLLPDAEIAEDYVEQIFDVDNAGDAAEAAQGEAEIFGAQFGQGRGERPLQ
jgi:hypothetical protein